MSVKKKKVKFVEKIYKTFLLYCCEMLRDKCGKCNLWLIEQKKKNVNEYGWQNDDRPS